MNTTIKLLGFASLALVACGDNKSRPDAAKHFRDSGEADAYCSDCPNPPVIGTTQLDRMGRPAINTALNRAFTGDTPASGTDDTAKDAYNADSTQTGWTTAYVGEFAQNLAILDVVDGLFCGNGVCETGETNTSCAADCPTAAQVGTAAIGCGNSAGITAGSNLLTTYGTMAGLLASDRLYVDTSKTTCAYYLAVEFGNLTAVGGVPTHTTCGGRAPGYDVIDFTYSALAAGTGGFTQPGFIPKIGDGVVAHTDLLTMFPYLGPPH